MDVRSTASQKAFNVFDELRKNRQLCDVILKADGQEFPAHRNILAACSPYFRALFTNGMNETKETSVEIPEVDPQLFSLLLDYAYTREVQITEENVEKILPLADQFNVPGKFRLKKAGNSFSSSLHFNFSLSGVFPWHAWFILKHFVNNRPRARPNK